MLSSLRREGEDTAMQVGSLQEQVGQLSERLQAAEQQNLEAQSSVASVQQKHRDELLQAASDAQDLQASPSGRFGPAHVHLHLSWADLDFVRPR